MDAVVLAELLEVLRDNNVKRYSTEELTIELYEEEWEDADSEEEVEAERGVYTLDVESPDKTPDEWLFDHVGGAPSFSDED